ncbi:MAG TPA: SDR family oxidoreductase [Solirubrobacterales bacterium]|nr:SDR family oxidoreductase [Solirubrobacterales bacterium]
MKVDSAHVVVTGGAAGIGAAAARAFARAGARAVVVADRDGEGARATAEEVGGLGIDGRGIEVDLGGERGVAALIDQAEAAYGPIDLFFSNAGIAGPYGGPEVPDEEWARTWNVNVMAHVWAARLLLPGMLARRHGHLSSTASAAGLLANPGLMPYSVTKHAAVAVAEWLAITYGGDGSGVGFSCFCPQGVATPMLETWRREDPSSRLASASGETISPDEAAQALLEGIEAGRFLILSHPEVQTYMQRKAADPERWLAGFQRFQAQIDAAKAADQARAESG